MKAIMVMYDSLNLHLLEPYGCDWSITPNFSRLAKRCATFTNNYVGSMPCMPARRELQTGRYNFLHRSWGPMEPYDDSMPELLKRSGIHSHLVSDHQHYWEDGGATYHTRYSTWDCVRGQEGDPWRCKVDFIPHNESGFRSAMQPTANPVFAQMHRNDQINRSYMQTEADQPQTKTFRQGLRFLEENHQADQWFLHLETFDPHEPFFTMQHYKDLYPHDYQGEQADWPPYYFVNEDGQTVEHVRREYAALLSMCDANLGKVLDFMDEHSMWEDTMLIVNTDHGYLLGEHGWWSKTVMPLYNEIAHTPLFIYDPRSRVQGVQRHALTQTIDLPATLLEFFGLPLPKDMQGRPLRQTIEQDTPVREYALYGFHGSHVNVTDGRYTYMKAPAGYSNSPLHEYTLMPTRMRSMFAVKDLQKIAVAEPFSFTKGCQQMKLPPEGAMTNPYNFGTRLYDLHTDPRQHNPLQDDAAELRMLNLLVRAMKENDTPPEQFERLGIPEATAAQALTQTELEAMRAREAVDATPLLLPAYCWSKPARNVLTALLRFIPTEQRAAVLEGFAQHAAATGTQAVTPEMVLAFAQQILPPQNRAMADYFLRLSARTL